MNVIDNPLLSIVVTSYTTERLRDIYDLLQSVRGQTYKKIEVIFVVEHSKELHDQVKSYAEKEVTPDIKVIDNDAEPGANVARNLGIGTARGEIIAFVDDDVILPPDWAEEMVKTYNDESIIGVTGPVYPLWRDKPALWLPEQFYWLVNCTGWVNWSTTKEVRNIWAMNASFRREAFDYGAFAPSLGPQEGGIHGWKKKIPEEIELSIRVREKTGKRIVYNPNSKVGHKVYAYKLKLKYMLQHAYLMGLCKYRTKQLYRNLSSSEDILSQEKDLLWRILKREPLCVVKEAFKNPYLAWRRFSIVTVALLAVSYGYITGMIRREESKSDA